MVKERIGYTRISAVDRNGRSRWGYKPINRDLGPKYNTTLESEISGGDTGIPREMMTEKRRNSLTPRRLRGKNRSTNANR